MRSLSASPGVLFPAAVGSSNKLFSFILFPLSIRLTRYFPGPVVSPNLARYGVQSAPLYRGLLNLAFLWFDPGRTRRPVRDGKHWLQVEDPERYPTITDDLLIELFYPTSTVKQRKVLATRARQILARLVKNGEARNVKGRLMPPDPGKGRLL